MAPNNHLLVTFLGKGQKTRDRAGYQAVSYEFEQGQRQTARLFGIALLRHLRRNRNGPGSLVVLGTSGSDWALFYDELDLLHDETILAHATELEQASAADCVTSNDIKLLEQRIQTALGVSCRFILIPYGETLNDQLAILELIDSSLADESQVTLDLTHGLRHLPMLGLLSALHLKASRRADVKAVFYGALDMRSRHQEGQAPVLQLDGLLDIGSWTSAFGAFDKDGDYSVFVPLLRKDGVSDEALKSLRRAAFLERTARVGEARSNINQFLRLTSNLTRLKGTSKLFAGELSERLSWVREASHYQRQRRLAFMHLEYQDYLRAALSGMEAFSALLAIEAGGNPTNPNDREKAMDEFHAFRQPADRYHAFDCLRTFRNAVVHVDNARSGTVTELFNSIEKLHDELSSWLNTLLPAAPAKAAQPATPGAAVNRDHSEV